MADWTGTQPVRTFDPGTPLQWSALTFNVAGTLTAVAGKQKVRMPAAGVILGTTAAIDTAPTGAALRYDVNKNGTTIFTTQGNRPTIAIAAVNSGTVTTSQEVTTFAAGDTISVDVDVIGSDVAGADLTVTVWYMFTA